MRLKDLKLRVHTHQFLAYLALITFVLVSSASIADGSKLNVCHIPPTDPFNFHTVTIGERALIAHQGHGDLVGACDGLCASLCDDGDACTIDDTADCESQGCPVQREVVDCDDSNACTIDSCDPIDGMCINEQAVICDAADLCHIATCDPLTGGCTETEKICGEGETCNLENGLCEIDGVAPVISGFAVAAVGSNTVTLEWMTDIPADSQVFFRLAGIGDFGLGATDPDMTTGHFIVLPTPLGNGLQSNTNYEIFARSTSESGVSSDSNILLIRTRR